MYKSLENSIPSSPLFFFSLVLPYPLPMLSPFSGHHIGSSSLSLSLSFFLSSNRASTGRPMAARAAWPAAWGRAERGQLGRDAAVRGVGSRSQGCAAGGLAGPGGERWRAGQLAALGGSVERWWQRRGLGQRLALGRAGARASGRAGGVAPECGGPSGGRSRARQQAARCRRGEQPRARGPRQSGSRSGGSGCNSLAERHGPRQRAWRG
jgi:hypothetical protein